MRTRATYRQYLENRRGHSDEAISVVMRHVGITVVEFNSALLALALLVLVLIVLLLGG